MGLAYAKAVKTSTSEFVAGWTFQFGGDCGSEKDVTVEEGCRHAAHNLDEFFTITPLVSLLSVLLTE